MFYAKLIVPLFNKQTPLKDGSLRSKIEAYASNVGFQLDNIFVIDGSKRSTKANAYFSGFGSEKRIISEVVPVAILLVNTPPTLLLMIFGL